jgi:hypothetical protein
MVRRGHADRSTFVEPDVSTEGVVDPPDEPTDAEEVLLARRRRPKRTMEEKLKSVVEPCLGLDIDRILTCKLRSGHRGPHIDPESGTRWGP